MSNKKVWFVTNASRGISVEFVKATLAASHTIVASAQDPNRVSKALRQPNDLLAVRLNVTNRANAEAAMEAAVDRFGRIDVLVNNAASFYAGYFEKLTPEQFDRQLGASLINLDPRIPMRIAGFSLRCLVDGLQLVSIHLTIVNVRPETFFYSLTPSARNVVSFQVSGVRTVADEICVAVCVSQFEVLVVGVSHALSIFVMAMRRFLRIIVRVCSPR